MPEIRPVTQEKPSYLRWPSRWPAAPRRVSCAVRRRDISDVTSSCPFAACRSKKAGSTSCQSKVRLSSEYSVSYGRVAPPSRLEAHPGTAARGRPDAVTRFVARRRSSPPPPYVTVSADWPVGQVARLPLAKRPQPGCMHLMSHQGCEERAEQSPFATSASPASGAQFSSCLHHAPCYCASTVTGPRRTLDPPLSSCFTAAAGAAHGTARMQAVCGTVNAAATRGATAAQSCSARGNTRGRNRFLLCPDAQPCPSRRAREAMMIKFRRRLLITVTCRGQSTDHFTLDTRRGCVLCIETVPLHASQAALRSCAPARRLRACVLHGRMTGGAKLKQARKTGAGKD